MEVAIGKFLAPCEEVNEEAFPVFTGCPRPELGPPVIPAATGVFCGRAREVVETLVDVECTGDAVGADDAAANTG